MTKQTVKSALMNKEFIPYNLALRLKALGFDKPCFGYYNYNGSELFNYKPRTAKKNLTKAPIFNQAFRWFRENCNMLGFIEPANGYKDKCLFAFYICDDEQNIINDEYSYSKDGSLHFVTYEEAELACLEKLIEIVEKKEKYENVI